MDLDVSQNIMIRAERPSDAAIISTIVASAYEAVPYSDHREHAMIELLRGSDAYVPELSLLAEVGGQVVGHILLTRATIEAGDTAATTLALAPLSIVPTFQRRGIGSRLVRAAHARATDLGFDSILLVGMSGYYQRFGYQPLKHYPIELPFDAPAENCLILPLRLGALDRVNGIVRYAEGWLRH